MADTHCRLQIGILQVIQSDYLSCRFFSSLSATDVLTEQAELLIIRSPSITAQSIIVAVL